MSLRETLEQIRSNPEPPNEEEMKIKILAPILAKLEWDPFGQEVLWEHPVGGNKKGGKVDIALRSEDRIWALIEAKAPGTGLSQHIEQLLGYAFYEGVIIGVLTDGFKWWLYLPKESGAPQERRFAVLRLLDDPVDQLSDDLTTFLGRESLKGDHAEKRAKQVLIAGHEATKLGKEMPQIWQRMLEEPDDELVELVGQRVYRQLNLRPGREQIIAVVSGRTIPPRPTDDEHPARPSRRRMGSPGPIQPRPTHDAATSTEPTTKPKGRRPPRRPTAIRLWGQRHPVQ